MAERGWGRVINVTGAIVGKAVNEAAPAKAALESRSKAAAGRYAARDVTVNCVAPGRLNTTRILKRLHPTEESRRGYIAQNIPAGRFGEPEEAASLIAFLASERASYITGTTIPVDGGSLRYAFEAQSGLCSGFPHATPVYASASLAGGQETLERALWQAKASEASRQGTRRS